MSRIKSALALVGACAALAIVVPPLAGLLNAAGSVTLLALAGYSAYRGWAWMESVVEASRRPTAVRRNMGRSDSPDSPTPSQTRRKGVVRADLDRDSAGSEERGLRRLQLRQAGRSWPER